MDTYNKFDVEKFKGLGKYMNLELGLPNFKEIAGVIYKLCTKCKKYKPMTDEYFQCRSNVKCGYTSHCKDCQKEKEKKRIRIKPFNKFGELYCHVCKTYKPISEFNTSGKSYKNRNGYSRECKQCESKRKAIYRASLDNDNVERFLRHLTYGCKTRSLQNKIDYDLSSEFIIELFYKQKGKCAISGLDLHTRLRSGKNTQNASVDRINPLKGYTKDNVQLVCSQVNMMKSNMSSEELYMFCEAIMKNKK